MESLILPDTAEAMLAINFYAPRLRWRAAAVFDTGRRVEMP